MGNFSEFDVKDGKIPREDLRMDFRKGKINANLSALRYIDKDTKQVVIYIPSLELSGYGEDLAKATEMLKFNTQEFFTYLTGLPVDDATKELVKLGWKKSLFNKQYSTVYVDKDGQLKKLNAENDIVERVTLTAA